MQLREYFDIGLTVDAYAQLLDEDQTDLHQMYERRACLDEDAIKVIRATGQHHILVVTEPWCGDSLAIFPVIAKLFTAARCEVRVIRRDEHTDLIDQFLTNGGRAIPMVIVLDDQFDVLFHWGPRPKTAQSLVMENKAAVAAGKMDKSEVHKMVRAFYARDHGKAIVSELVEKFTN